MDMDVPFDTEEKNKKEPYMTLEAAEKDWKAWAEVKSQTLNGKDAAALMGHAPWRTADELLAEKKKLVSFVPEKGSKEANLMQRGLELQDKVKKEFTEVTGIQLEPGAIYRNEDVPVMVARVQFQSAKDGMPVQVMTTGEENRGIWENGAPQSVIDEAQWNMAVTGASKVYVGCLIDDRNSTKDATSKDFVAITVSRDDKYIAAMVKEAERFSKALESKFLNVDISSDMVTKKNATYEVKMPEDSLLKGNTVVIPEKMVFKHRYDNGFRLSMPIKNYKGSSFLFKRVGDDKAKSASAGEIFCAVNKVRGKLLFANNRQALKEYWNKKKNQALLEAKEQEARMG